MFRNKNGRRSSRCALPASNWRKTNELETAWASLITSNPFYSVWYLCNFLSFLWIYFLTVPFLFRQLSFFLYSVYFFCILHHPLPHQPPCQLFLFSSFLFAFVKKKKKRFFFPLFRSNNQKSFLINGRSRSDETVVDSEIGISPVRPYIERKASHPPPPPFCIPLRYREMRPCRTEADELGKLRFLSHDEKMSLGK